jgi:hypothetical protein
MTTLPQHWAEKYAPLPDGWLQAKAAGLLQAMPNFPAMLRAAAEAMGVHEHLLVTRCELEQSAITYAWDGSTTDYGGGRSGEKFKLRYLCGADRTDSGDRPGGWFGPGRQLLACALRFRYWYRGQDGPRPEWRNWLGLEEDPAYQPEVPVTRGGTTLIPANQISADCLRYTTGMDAQTLLSDIAREWFPDEFEDDDEKTAGGISSMSTLTQLAPTMESLGAWLKSQTPGHGSIQAIVLHHTEDPTSQNYQGVSTIEAIRQYHLSKGWSDIGANLYACPDGTVITGRPISADNFCHAAVDRPWDQVEPEAKAISGGDNLWFNHYAIGIETVANFDTEDPYGPANTSARNSYETAMQVMEVICQVFNLDSSKVFFHRDVADKTCPGMKLSRADVRSELHNHLVEIAAQEAKAAAESGLHVFHHGVELPCNVSEENRDGQNVGRADLRPLVEGLGYTLQYTALPNGGRLDILDPTPPAPSAPVEADSPSPAPAPASAPAEADASSPAPAPASALAEAAPEPPAEPLLPAAPSPAANQAAPTPVSAEAPVQ